MWVGVRECAWGLGVCACVGMWVCVHVCACRCVRVHVRRVVSAFQAAATGRNICPRLLIIKGHQGPFLSPEHRSAPREKVPSAGARRRRRAGRTQPASRAGAVSPADAGALPGRGQPAGGRTEPPRRAGDLRTEVTRAGGGAGSAPGALEEHAGPHPAGGVTGIVREGKAVRARGGRVSGRGAGASRGAGPPHLRGRSALSRRERLAQAARTKGSALAEGLPDARRAASGVLPAPGERPRRLRCHRRRDEPRDGGRVGGARSAAARTASPWERHRAQPGAGGGQGRATCWGSDPGGPGRPSPGHAPASSRRLGRRGVSVGHSDRSHPAPSPATPHPASLAPAPLPPCKDPLPPTRQRSRGGHVPGAPQTWVQSRNRGLRGRGLTGASPCPPLQRWPVAALTAWPGAGSDVRT